MYSPTTLTDPTQPGDVDLIPRARKDLFPTQRFCPFRNSQDAEEMPRSTRSRTFATTASNLNGISGIRITSAPPAMPGMQGDEACIASHQFQDHDPVMCFGRGMQFVDGFRGGLDGGIKPKGHFGAADIVVDRLGNTNDRCTLHDTAHAQYAASHHRPGQAGHPS